MRRYLFGITTLMAASLVLGACSSEPEPNVLQAVKGTVSSMNASAGVWSDAPVLMVDVAPIEGIDGATSQTDMEIQAVYNDTEIWFRFEWADATKSQTRMWTFDGSAWSKGGNEDRLGLYWQINPVDQFGTKGCTALCHDVEDDPNEWYMITPRDGQRADNWHWKAQRSDPVGYADDKWLGGVLTDPDDVESANHGDSKDSGGYSGNSAEGGGPAKMGPSLDSAFLLASEAIDLDMARVSAGTQIPKEILARPVGSRGDIDAQGTYNRGKWVVVMHRALDTGNNDDVEFNTARDYPFGLSVFDNAGGFKHAVSQEVLFLQFD